MILGIRTPFRFAQGYIRRDDPQRHPVCPSREVDVVPEQVIEPVRAEDGKRTAGESEDEGRTLPIRRSTGGRKMASARPQTNR